MPYLLNLLKVSLFTLLFTQSGYALNPTPSKDIVDIHTHIACVDEKNNGCYVSPRMIKNIRFRYYLKSLGITKSDLQNNTADQKMIKNLVNLVKESKRLKKVVILALDGVVDKMGRLDFDKTEIYIPNDYIYKISKNNSTLLPGASINPYRKDALERLDKAYQNGAKLIKWLPNTMHINPSDKKLIPFYEKLKSFDLPLLTHTGFEHSFSHSDNTLGDPALLELPLSLGVKVIAAHFGTGGKNGKESNFKRILPLFKKYPHLYGDISGLTLLTKLGAIKKILKHSNLHDRILYGSDYPLLTFPVTSPLYHIFKIKPSELRALFKIKNRFDRDIALKEMLGVPIKAMQRSVNFLKL